MASIRLVCVSVLLAAAACAGDVDVSFRSARPIWPAGREKEMNVLAGFRTVFAAPAGERVTLRVAGSTLYRAYVNGQFQGWGPARGPHGFYRVDVWDITNHLRPGRNVVAIEVAGYNVNSYWVLNQPSFLQTEVTTEKAVLASTQGAGEPFEARVLTERVQKVQRYSFQRAFVEVYSLGPGFDRWRQDPDAPFAAVECAAAPAKRLIPRRAPYPDFALRQPSKHVMEGRVGKASPKGDLWEDRSLTRIGPQFLGYPQAELAQVVSRDLQYLSYSEKTAMGTPYVWNEAVPLASGRFHTFDFGTNLSGFLGARIVVRRPTRLYLTFDEILVNDDVDFKRNTTVNAVTYDLQPGTYDVEAFEPYTMRYVKAIVTTGDCSLERLYLREYANPDVWRAQFASSDAGLNRLFAAGRETYRQNSVDLLTDCPSRERAGWLCDSYFSGRVEHLLTGRPVIEKAFLENFALPARFEYLPDGMLPMCYPADHPDRVFIPNWPLWMVLELEEYQERSGDRELVEAMRPRVMKLLDYFRPFRNSDGLLEHLQSWVFVEWSAANDFVQDVNYPSNMLYAAAMAAAGRMYHAPELAAEAAKVQETIRKQAFDGEYFVDNAVRKDGKLVPTRNHTETCQYYAFYLGTATPETQPKLWKSLVAEFGPGRKKTGLHPDVPRSNAFIGNVLRMELLSRNGLTQKLIDESRDYWLYMAERTGTLWEMIDDKASADHGFASHVVNNLYRDILGLYRIDDMRKIVELRFTDTSLAWCEGRVPVGDGAVSLRWTREGGTLSYQLDVPAGYIVRVMNQSRDKLRPLAAYR